MLQNFKACFILCKPMFKFHCYFQALLKNQQTTHLNRFLHYYTRFKNHENSRKLEEGLLTGVRKKMENLASSFKKGEGKYFVLLVYAPRLLLMA